MIYTILSTFNILIAAAMTVLILMQRGAGADAGASFGGGGSGTVFGARGSATFLSRATGVLAALFFVVSLAMGMMLEQQTRQQPDQGLGIMAGLTQDNESIAAGASVVETPQPATVAPTATSAGDGTGTQSAIPVPQPAKSASSG